MTFLNDCSTWLVWLLRINEMANQFLSLMFLKYCAAALPVNLIMQQKLKDFKAQTSRETRDWQKALGRVDCVRIVRDELRRVPDTQYLQLHLPSHTMAWEDIKKCSQQDDNILSLKQPMSLIITHTTSATGARQNTTNKLSGQEQLNRF